MESSNLRNLRSQVMENSEELQDFLQDLKSWEQDMKRKDEELRSKPPESRNQTLEKIHTSVKKIEKIGDDESGSSSDGNEDELTVLQNKQKALFQKDKGNSFFSQGKYDDAIACYTSGILADPTNAVLPANRAMALLKKGQLAAAEQDCTLSISLDCTYVKAFHRRGTCRFALKKFQLARQDFLKVLEMEPTNKFARAEMDKLEQEFIKMDKPNSGISIKGLGNEADKAVLPSSELKQVLQTESTTSNLENEEKSTHIFHDLKKKKSHFADLPDQVKPIYKPTQKRSKNPLRHIPVDMRSSDEEELVIPVIQRPTELAYKQPATSSGSLPTPSPLLSTPSTPKSLPPIPITAFQFETDWRRLRHWPHLRVQYLQQLAPEDLCKMYQQSIETEIFVGILHSVKDICQSDKEAAYLYLKHLTKVGRFATLIMFLADEETRMVRDILENIPTATTTQEIENLKALYGIKSAL